MPDVFIANTKIKKQKRLKTKTNPVGEKKKLTYSQKIIKSRPNPDQHPLSSFRYFPDKAEFVNKDPEEKVILLLRRHPVTNYQWIVIASLMLVAPSFLTVFPFFEAMPSTGTLPLLVPMYIVLVEPSFE